MSSLKPGHWTPPVLADAGIIIYYYHDMRPARNESLHQVKQVIAKQIRKEKAQGQFLAMSDRLVDQVYAESDSLNETASILKLTKHTSPWMTLATAKKGLFSDDKILHAAMSEGVLQERQNSGLIPLGQDKAMVIRVLDYRPDQRKPLPEVREQIKLVLTKQSYKAGQMAYANKLARALNGVEANQVKQIVQQFKLPLNSAKMIMRGDSKSYDLALNTAAFSLPIADSAVHAKVVDLDAQKGQVHVVYVLKVLSGKKPNESLENFDSNLEAKYGEMEYLAASIGLVKQAVIEIPASNN